MAVVGDSGSGKSALLSSWSIAYRSRLSEGMVLAHFIGSSRKSTELGAMLARLNYELGQYLGIEDDASSSPAPEAETAGDQAAGEGAKEPDEIFRERLIAAGAKGKVVLVLDALNQLSDEDDALGLGWLPTEIPEGVRLVVSTLKGEVQDELKARGWLEGSLKVRPLERKERDELIEIYLGRGQAKRLSDTQIEAIIDPPQASSPLYLRILLDELRVYGRHESLDARIRRLTSATTIPELLEMVLARYEAAHKEAFGELRPDLVADAMSLIWASHQGLQEAELLGLLAEEGRSCPPPSGHISGSTRPK